MHEHGMGVALNDTRSAYWWQRALDNGYIDIAKGLGSMYMSGRGVPLDYERGMELYLFAAEHGHPHAIKFVALGYQRGLGLPQDDEKAAEWAAKAAALDGPNADVVFLDSMQSKETELQTEEQMFAEFLGQANKGNARGFYYVSVAFTSGTGVARNYIEAERWAREAAERGLTSGIRQLGLFHQLDRLQLWLIVPAVWAVQLAISHWWLKRSRFGPLEWLWRTLTYMRWQKALRD
ncbi:MAG: SEL1-like repeat protein, partial [Planctomycetes bacterium]|nr:SEL1-like repeat protein [Planctomycetota bacterium]